MKVLAVLLLAAVAVLAQDSYDEANVGIARGIAPPDNFRCQIHYECKHYKWFCFRSEYAFCVDNKCQCFPRYHFGYRHPYHRP
ncbi:unnamed protein product [Colias eurytheme]|nr:unnamed protein product [Colias eurytheme]